MTATAPLPRAMYGHGKTPFGPCELDACEKAACFRISNDNGGQRLVCRVHLPSDIIFVPFLGQQEKLFATNARYVLGGGGAGPGKTYCGARLWMKQYYVDEQRIARDEIDRSRGRALFLRRTMPEIIQVIDDFKSYYKRIDPNAKWDAAHNLCRFENGFIARFGGMEDADDWQKYWGDYWTLVVADEAVQFLIKQLEKIDQRIRCDDPVLEQMLQFYYLTNPIAPRADTKAYLKARFVRRAPPETEVQIQTKLEDGRTITATQIYIPSNVFDNPAYAETGQYEATLRRHGSNTIRALLYNDWDVDEGAWVGDDWDPTIHICAPFPVPKGWFRFKAMDYGFSARTAVQWFACDPENNMVCYRSWSCRGLTAEDVARRVREIEIDAGEWDTVNDLSLIYGPADASMWSRTGEGPETRGEILDRFGSGFVRGPNTYGGYREDAADAFRSRLRRRTANAAGDMVVPGIRFFNTCVTKLRTKDGWEETGPISTIPGLPIDQNRPDCWDTDADDHDADTTGMACTSRPLSGEQDSTAEPANAVVFDILKFRKQQSQGNAFPDWYAHGRK